MAVATRFITLHGMIRAILDDTPVNQCYRYTTAVINSHIALQIITHPTVPLQEDATVTVEDNRCFTTTLTDTQKGYMTFAAARSIFAPTPSKFAYKQPILSIARDNDKQAIWAYLTDMVDRLKSAVLEGGAGTIFGFSTQTDIEAYVNSAYIFFTSLSRANAHRGEPYLGSSTGCLGNPEFLMLSGLKIESQFKNLSIGDNVVIPTMLSSITDLEVFVIVEGNRVKVTSGVTITISGDSLTASIHTESTLSDVTVLITGRP